MKTITIIAITGASGSGKSFFSEQLQRIIKQEMGFSPVIIAQDNYYKAQDGKLMEERVVTNYDHPDAFEHSLLAQHLTDLKAGNDIALPQYCYVTHTRKNDTTPLSPTPLVIVDGIMLLADQALAEVFELSIFVDTPLDICLLRRALRDTQHRGRTLDSVAKQYLSTVKPMYHQFIEPAKQQADVILPYRPDNNDAMQVLLDSVKSTLK